jgi:hypothetical protein
MGELEMESLAILGAIVVFTPIISGVFALVLSLPVFAIAINSRSKNVALILTIIRRLIQGFFLLIGLPLSCFLLFIDILPLKFLGLFSLALLYFALHLEYFSKNSNFRGKKVQPVYSADGSEIIRAKKVKRFGISSGRDGHGPGGQH